nr:retrotransposon protein, putative, unclassified [Tanacetum cinerariifolium]
SILTDSKVTPTKHGRMTKHIRPPDLLLTVLSQIHIKMDMEDSGFKLIGFLDADYVGCKDTFKSTFGGARFLSEKLVSWSSKKQGCTALLITEAEYVSLSACCA